MCQIQQTNYINHQPLKTVRPLSILPCSLRPRLLSMGKMQQAGAEARGGRHFPDTTRYPIENELVRLVDRYLARAAWPLRGYPCRIEFEARPNVPSRHELTSAGVNGRGEHVGHARLIFNFVHLYQLPGPFLTDIVPHEVAHLISQLQGIKSGIPIEMHGKEWREWLAKLSHRAEPKASAGTGLFDDRSIRLYKGGLLGRCQCEGPAGFMVVSKRQQKEQGCGACKSSVRLVPLESAPAALRDEVDFIRNYLEEHEVYGWLGE